MGKLVPILADNPAFPYVSFDRGFWDEQKLDLFDAIVSLGEANGNNDSESVRNVKNLYWFVDNIDRALDNNGVAVVIPSEGM